MSSFDSEEHFFLALNAISEKAHDRAIDHLKEITSGEYYSRAVYLLGAEYAEIGMYDRAKQSFQSIIDVEPLKEMVRLQKGLLHIFLDEQHEARLCLGQLVEVRNEASFIYWFAQGILVSLDSQNQKAIECLKKGVELNEVNEPLNEDMRKYIEKLSVSSPDVTATESSEKSKNIRTEISNKFLLTNYKDES
jgi:tetratricopeptide (TPR) repeat protein